MADYFYAMLKDGILVMLPVKDINNVKAEVEQLKSMGYKLPRFSEQFNPVNGTVVRKEPHDKQTKTGKPMWRFYVKEDGEKGAEHMIIAFEEFKFKKGERVKVTMGNYGKEATPLDNGWDDDESDDDDNATHDDIPF